MIFPSQEPGFTTSFWFSPVWGGSTTRAVNSRLVPFKADSSLFEIFDQIWSNRQKPKAKENRNTDKTANFGLLKRTEPIGKRIEKRQKNKATAPVTLKNEEKNASAYRNARIQKNLRV
jgi:hypothetical protein